MEGAAARFTLERVDCLCLQGQVALMVRLEQPHLVVVERRLVLTAEMARGEKSAS
jgi:hypothetical protein